VKLFSKKVALIALAGVMAIGTFIAAPSAEAHGRDRGWRDRDRWSYNRGNHYGWRNNDRRGWRDDRGPRFRQASWRDNRRGYYSNRGWDRGRDRYYR
jgi:hypothetical protein